MILRADHIRDRYPNARLIERAHALDRLGGLVLDATFERGSFWRYHRPERLVTMDAFKPAAVRGDFCRPPFRPGTFDTVVYDPPYKLNGRPDPDPDGPDARYGVGDFEDWEDRADLIINGVFGLAPLVAPGGHLLVKCMDQVCRYEMRFQTDDVTFTARELGLKKVEALMLLSTPRPQPAGRTQRHAAANFSTLLIFQRPKEVRRRAPHA